MSVRKRTWTNANGETNEAWVVDYRDKAKGGARVQRTFHLKKEADAFAVDAKVEVRDGIHIARSKSVTVAQAGKFWIATAETNNLERATVANYQQLLDTHIVPFIGTTKISDLSVPMVRAFEDKLREAGRSAKMVKRVRNALSMLLSDAMERGLATRNVARGLKSNRTRGKERQAEKRQKGKLKVGVDIPTLEEVHAIIPVLKGRWRALLLTAMFCGLRSSELRGLRWIDIEFADGKIHVRQRADRYHKIGRPKSESGERSIPMLPMVANALKEWKVACPRRDTGRRDEQGSPIRELHYVFPNRKGNVESHPNIVTRGLWPVQIAAGVTAPVLGDDGEPKLGKDGLPVLQAKYTGLHALRHFFASWCINPKEKGGRELPAKVVQEWLGHSSITMTMDIYGHLFPSGDDAAELAAAEKAFLARNTVATSR
jgi:integrase